MFIFMIKIANVNGVIEQVATARCRHSRRLPSARISHCARRSALGQARPGSKRPDYAQAPRQRTKAQATGRLVLTRDPATSLGNSRPDSRSSLESTTIRNSNHAQQYNESTMAQWLSSVN